MSTEGVPGHILLTLNICPVRGRGSEAVVHVWCAWDPDDLTTANQARVALRPYFEDGVQFVFVRPLGRKGAAFDEVGWIHNMIAASANRPGSAPPSPPVICSFCGERASDSRRMFAGEHVNICSAGAVGGGGMMCSACLELARELTSS
jgi:hypothetical protein